MPVEVSLHDIDCSVDIKELEEPLVEFIKSSVWPESIKTAFLAFVASDKEHLNRLNTIFTTIRKSCSPLIIYHEGNEEFYIVYIDKERTPHEPGEPGSVLAYLRAYGYSEEVLCSDCYGQLSCSSCAIEIHNGQPENQEPRDEEYDMLDIDTDRPATSYTRLGCQAIIGKTPLVVTVRKPKVSFN